MHTIYSSNSKNSLVVLFKTQPQNRKRLENQKRTTLGKSEIKPGEEDNQTHL